MRRVINLFKLSIFSLIVTTILTFTIFGSTISATEKKISNNVIAKSESAIRFDGIYQAVTKRGYNYQVSMYIRFYPNRKACTVKTTAEPKNVVPHYLKDNIHDISSPRCGEYLIDGSKIKINAYGIDFWGDIRKDSLVLKVDDSKYGYKAAHDFWFIKGPEYAERPELSPKKPEKKLAKKPPEVKTKQIGKKTDEQLFEGEYITGIIKYDQYGLYNGILLKNIKGELVAKKLIMRSPYNPTQITGEIIRDVAADKDIHYTKVEGSANNPMWICLDKDGNIVKKAGKPALVKPFQAMQRTEYEIKYHGAFKDKKLLKFYPCSNCASETGIKDCVYVW